MHPSKIERIKRAKNISHISLFIVLLLLTACQPQKPITSTITVDLEKFALPVNKSLYGISLDEHNHAIEGGLYAEMIQNRSFEDGVIPYGCRYNSVNKSIITPSLWEIPFIPWNAIPGWRTLSSNTGFMLDGKTPLNENNTLSLFIRTSHSGIGGVVAEGYDGLSLIKDEKYQLSFYIRGNAPTKVTVELRDSLAEQPRSDAHRVTTTDEWRSHQVTFTAKETDPKGTLVFYNDSNVIYSLDMVSLFPEKTWRDRPNGFRPELMEAIEALQPQFVRFPGTNAIEGYAFSSIPQWSMTIGPVESRRSTWSTWGYGLSHGVGFLEYLKLCEELRATPIYAANAGILNQRHSTVVMEQKNMDYFAYEIKRAFDFANSSPFDSLQGTRRAEEGRPSPFDLKHIALGYENHGEAYRARYQTIRRMIKAAYPATTFIKSDSGALAHETGDWINTNYLMSADQLIANSNCFDTKVLTTRTPTNFISSFGAAYSNEGGTLRGAVGEAAFLIGAERNPINVKGIAYSPLLGHRSFPSYGKAAITFNSSQVVKTPSYYLLEMFNKHRGDVVLVTNTQSYNKPLVSCGKTSIVVDGDSHEFKEFKYNDEDQEISFKDDQRNIQFGNRAEDESILFPTRTSTTSPNSKRRRYLLIGDSSSYNNHVSIKLKQTKNEGGVWVNLRDNGLVDEKADRVALFLANGEARLFQCTGKNKRPLSEAVPISTQDMEWHHLEMRCKDDVITCHLDGSLLIEEKVLYKPSLVALATYEEATQTIVLKVVNTTMHEEYTSIDILGGRVQKSAKRIRLSGPATAQNTLEHPTRIVPQEKTIKFSSKQPITFPANSITILRIQR